MASENWPFANAWSIHGNKDIVSRYEILERIGEGTFGEVHKARRREDSVIVAMKEIHNSDSSCREIKALLLLDHPNVIKLHEYFAHGSSMVLVLEYLPYNLYEVIRSGKGALSEGEVKGWMIQILRGLAACHAASILHRDMKPNNLLISEDRTLKIADFGQARVVSQVDFANEAVLSGSEIQNSRVSGSEGHSNQELPTTRYSREMEFEADVALGEDRMDDDKSIRKAGLPLNSRKSETAGDHFGVGTSKYTGKGNLAKGIVEQITPGADFASDSAGRDSENFGRNVFQSGSGPTNVGYSALADAVKDARNYFTIEEMVRSGTGMDGLGLSSLQRQHIIGSQNTEGPGCCGWFPLENVESRPAMTGGRNSSSANDTYFKDDTVSFGRDHVREGEGDLSSDESDVDWKRKYGIRSAELIDTVNRTQEAEKIDGVSPSSAKAEGDFLQKLRRFIRKRTRRLNTEGRVAGPGHSRNERTSTGARENSLKETQKDGQMLDIHRSPRSRQNASSKRNSASAKSITSALQSVPPRTAIPNESMAFSQGQQVYSQAQPRKGTRNFDGKQRKTLNAGSTNDLGQDSVVVDGDDFERIDEVSAVSRLKDEYRAQQSLSKKGSGPIVSEKSEDDVMDGAEDGDLRTESGRKLYGGLQVERTIRSKLVVNGPLRKLADAGVHEVGETAAIAQLDFQDDVQPEREFREVETAYWQMRSMDMEKAKGEETYTMTEDENEAEGDAIPWTDYRALVSSDLIAQEALRANKCEIPSSWGRCWKDVDNSGETLNGRWEGSSAEPILGRESWTQMEGYNSMSSDAEGTRWYGAPEIRYSYMDSKNVHPGGGKAREEIYSRVTGSEEEWEDGSEGGTYQRSFGGSQESIERGLSESEHGSDFTTMVGTRWYKAPELLYGATKYGKGIDMWALGCIFGELLWGKPLFPGLNDIDQLSRVVRILGSPNEKIWTGVSLLPDFDKICFVDDRSPLTLKNYLPDISDSALGFLHKLLTYNPLLRPSAEKALEDEYFLKQPLPCPCHELQLPTGEENEASDEEWGDWKDPGSPISDFEILG